ncbi:MAG: MFS transporter [Candidatus Lokiarchaeota archaeon]|nr:MFS transporter [Candidatus Lokiarchaeota archaeon]MBD3342908.1 MFS transporter [Candidatus Lokiarchaeota archaeon]
MSSEKKTNHDDSYSSKHALAFSSAQISDIIAYQSFSFLIFTFYFTVVRVNVTLITIGFVIWSVWNAINDPLLGALSDRTHSKWGRRIPWIAASTIPLSVVMILLFTPPIVLGLTDQIVNFVYFLIIIIIFELFYTMFSINQTSLFPEVFIDIKDRAKANNIKQIFGIIGLIVAFVLPSLFIPDLTQQQYLNNYIIFGVVLCILILIGAIIFLKWGAKERVEFKEDYKNAPQFFTSVKMCVKNECFRWTALSLIMVWFVFGMLPTIIPLYGKFVLGIDNSIFISLMLALAFISAAIFVNLWKTVVVRIGARRTWMLSVLAWIACLIPLMFISDMIWGFIIFFFMGLGFAGSLFLRDITWGDIIDEDEIKTGIRREAAYYGVNALFMRFSTILIFLAINLVFTSTGWAVYAPDKVTPSVIFGLRLLMVVFPVIALSIALIGFYKFPLDGERLQEVKKAQKTLNEEKKSRI